MCINSFFTQDWVVHSRGVCSQTSKAQLFQEIVLNTSLHSDFMLGLNIFFCFFFVDLLGKQLLNNTYKNTRIRFHVNTGWAWTDICRLARFKTLRCGNSRPDNLRKSCFFSWKIIGKHMQWDLFFSKVAGI